MGAAEKLKLNDEGEVIESDGKPVDDGKIILFHLEGQEQLVTVTDALSIINELSGVLLAHGYCRHS